METIKTFQVQMKALGRTFLILHLPLLISLLVALGICLARNRSLGLLTRDPAMITNTSAFWGFFSNLGILIWCATVAVCFLTGWVLRQGVEKGILLFFFFSGGISLVLLLDDFFLLHERFYPYYLHIPEVVTKGIYGAVVLAFFLASRRTILRTNFVMLLSALFFFTISILVDLEETGGSFHYLFEDGPKLLGQASWFAYYAQTAVEKLGEAMTRGGR